MDSEIKKRPFKLHVILGIVLLLLIILITVLYVKDRQEAYRCTNYAMGTYIEQTVYGKNAETAAVAAVYNINELENQISWRRENSDIYHINNSGEKISVDISEDTFNLLNLCKDIAFNTNGSFDPTILPISSLWNFTENTGTRPNDKDINKFLSYVDYNNLAIDDVNKKAYLKNELSALDLGAIGKGTACEKAIEAYSNNGVDCAIVSVGGSVGVLGNKKGSSAWNIAVRDPFKAFENTYSELGVVKLKSGYISTSGTYEKYFYNDNKLYHHILDPNTGYPVDNNLICVSIMSNNGSLSDALSTGCFVLGIDKSIPVLSNYDAEAIFVTKDKNVYITRGIENMFSLTSDEYKLNIIN